MQILLVDDDELERRVLARSLESESPIKVDAVASGPAALDRLSVRAYDAVITDIMMHPMDGVELVRRIRRQHVALPVIVLTANATVDLAVDAMRAGATDFMPKPVNTGALLALLNLDVAQTPLREELAELKQKRGGVSARDFLIGDHPLLDGVRHFAEKLAQVREARVLIQGESGTGKSYLARAIHALSGGSGRFVEVSCATLPPALIESELFGHEKGAFTDAKAMKKGLVEMANGGTLFLDEIGALPLDMQTKLLVFLESRQIRRVGGNQPIASDARVIAATNDDLKEAVRSGRFRGDLLYRLDVSSVRMPSLREMPNIIPQLADRFAGEIAEQFKRPKPVISEESIEALKRATWPGNARELRNVVERAMIFHEHGPLSITPPAAEHASQNGDGVVIPRGVTLEDVERIYIQDAMEEHGGDLNSLAEQLGISRKTLWDKRRRYGRLDNPGGASRQ